MPEIGGKLIFLQKNEPNKKPSKSKTEIKGLVFLIAPA
jgi:hypothetical protein